MATTTSTRRPPRPTNGVAPPGAFDLEAPPTGRGKSRWPEITLGLFLVALFALAGTWFYVSSTDKTPVIALRNAVERGELITTDDLRVVEIDSDDQLNLIGRDQSGLIVGRIALTDMGAGTLITAEQFAAGSLIQVGDGVVGLALDPGEYPSLSLRPGDLVRVVQTPRPGDEVQGELVIVEAAEVVDIGPIGVQNQLFISLSMPTEEADLVAAAGAQDRVRLIQVARG